MGGHEPKLDNVPTINEYERIVQRLRDEATRRPWIENVLPLTVVITGARISEVLMLTTTDVDFDYARLYIPTLKHKGRPKRAFPLPRWYLPIIRDYIVRNRISYELFPVSRKTAYLMVKRKTGYHPHAFRHVVAMYFLFRRVDPETVRRIMGHATWKMIEYYIRIVNIEPARNPLEDLW